METEKSAAVLTIKDAGNMTPEGRKEVADWLRQCAKTLVKHGKDYAPRFRARYLYRD
jgi:hypothetical protein